MNFKPTKFGLRLASGAMLLISACVIVTSVFLPIDRSASSVAQSLSTTGPMAAATTGPSSEIIDFSDVLDTQLSRPLIDPVPATRSSMLVNNDAAFGLRLTGTIMEPMHTYAVLTDPGGKTVVKSVGDTAGGASILAITADSVSLQINGKPVVLHVVKPSNLGVLAR